MSVHVCGWRMDMLRPHTASIDYLSGLLHIQILHMSVSHTVYSRSTHVGPHVLTLSCGGESIKTKQMCLACWLVQTEDVRARIKMCLCHFFLLFFKSTLAALWHRSCTQHFQILLYKSLEMTNENKEINLWKSGKCVRSSEGNAPSSVCVIASDPVGIKQYQSSCAGKHAERSCFKFLLR